MTARLICFARAPQPGAAKTRLIPALGADAAAALHSRLVEHTLERAARAAEALNARLELHCTPDVDAPLFTRLAERYPRLVRRRQRGACLGARMHAALGPAGPALLFGCDCPGWTPDDLGEALEALVRGADAVFGPAADGGYYLVATRASDPAVFTDMPWGSRAVMAATRVRLARLRWRWHELPTYPDIDRPEDLVYLPRSLQSAHGRKEDRPPAGG